MNTILICHRCPHRQKDCAGPCDCTVDGRDIIDHATAGDCPKGFYADASKLPAPAPAPPCSGCGGAKYDPQTFNRPGGADELVRQLG